MVLLLPSAWLACLLLLREMVTRRWIEPDWRFSFILACAAWGIGLNFGTELLSLAILLNAPMVRLFWLFANLALWGGWYFFKRKNSLEPRREGWTFADELRKLRAWPLDARLMLGAALLFAAFLGGIALLTTTTNWDSLTYHLARVMHWLQQQSVAHYPTNMDGQLQMGPWSAFVQAHLWLLWGNDRFANLVQWSAMLGSMVIATLLARQLLPVETQAGLRAQAFAALLVVTLPTGIVESITTQTDYTTGFWLLSLAALGLAWCREPGNWIYALGFGATLGLGVMTKFTMVFYAAPIGVAVAATLLWQERRAWASLLPPALAALTLCLALVLPHFIRNQIVFGSAIGSQTVQGNHSINHVSLSGILSNLIRNVELHSNTGMPALTHQLNRLAHTIQGWTGRAPDDPALSNFSSMYEPPDEFFVFDSFAASPWHAGLVGIAAVVGMMTWRKNRLALAGMGLAFAGFVFFCMTLRWQIWNSRYHLPPLLLFMPLVAAVLVPRISRWVVYAGGLGLLVFGMVIVANNRSRPIFDASWRAKPRLEQLVSFQGEKYYAGIARRRCRDHGERLRGCRLEHLRRSSRISPLADAARSRI